MKKISALLAAVLLTTGLRAQQVVIVNTAAELSNAFLTAASGSEIRLTSDIAMDSTLWLGTELMGDSSSEGSRSLILNLFGHTLSRTDGSKRLIDLTHGDLTITSTFEGGQILDLASGSSIEDLILVTGSTLKDIKPMEVTEGFFSCLTVSAGVTITAVENAITIDRVGAADGHNIQYGTDVYARGTSAQQYRSVANGVRLQVCGEIHAQKYCVKPNGFLAAPTTDGTTLRTRNTNAQYANYTVDAEDVDYVPYIYICSSAVLTTSDTTAGTTALYASGYANWYIVEGATCSGNIGLYVKSGELRVWGANIASTNPVYTSANSPYASGVSAGGSAVVLESSLSGNGPVSLDISGGSTISAESGYAIEEILTADSMSNVTLLGVSDCILKGGDAGVMLLSSATTAPSIFYFDEETVTTIEKQTESDCLDNISWQISEDSTLYVTGDGAICDYTVDVDGVRAPWAVYGPDVMRLELSEGITHIGDIAFLDFGNLVAVTCHALTPPTLGNYVFTITEQTSSCPLYVPAESVLTYQSDSAWSSYFSNVQAIGGDTTPTNPSGICGDSLTWEFNPADSTLTISGSGAMTNYSYLESAPWYTYKADLVHAILPDDLTTIGDQAFKSCSALISVTIPSSVTSIGNEAFYGCTGLETITCEAVTPPMWGDDAFAEVPNTIPVYVPAASVTTYQTSYTGWNLFTNIQAIPCSTPYEFSETYNLCGTDSFTWHGNVYTESGIYIDTLQSVEGCDSIITLELNLLPTYSFAEDTTIYEGDTIFWRERTLTEAGTYYDSLTSVFGCDSVYQLTLTLEPVPSPCEGVEYHSTDSIAICDGMPVLWHGQMYMNTGVYVDTVQSIFGCDSICTLQLTVNPNYLFSDEMEVCEGDSLIWHGRTLTKGGVYTDSLITIAGCDSIFTLHLTVNPKYLIEDIVSVREDKLPYMWQGEAITQSGDYRKEYTSSTGCDSVHTLHFTVTALPIYTVNVVADHGRVNGTGTYPEGTRIYLTAVPDEGFEFQMWSDGGETNPKQFVVTQDTTLRAHFYMPEVEQEVTVDSIETTSVTITWDTVPGATLYELRIYKNGELVVTLQVDKDNNIIDAAFAGPDRIIARKDSTGGSSETLQVNVGGLDPGQDYTYSLDAMNDDRNYVGAQSGSFTTEEEPIDRLDTLFDDRRTAPRKLLRDGRLYIEMPDGTEYDARGQIIIDN